MSLSKMPCIVVVLTIGYLAIIHFGNFLSIGTYERWRTEPLEEAYLEASAKYVRPPVNRVRAWMNLDANDVVMRGGELYYLPDLKHVIGRSFLDEAGDNSHVVLRRAQSGGRARDPMTAILDFDRQLREREIQLVLLPTPSKAMFSTPGESLVRNAGFADFLKAMENHGIPVFDPGPRLAQRAGENLFLRNDTHWTPATMQFTAEALAGFLRERGLGGEGRSDEFELTTRKVTNEGDLTVLLHGVEKKRWKETVIIRSVGLDEGPLRWSPDPRAPVLLLGDSFTNVFSLDDMNWGVSAGFGEHLSVALGRSIDRLARNADGAFSAREELSRQPQRLAGKTVVVWQFAARELSFGDWKILPLSERAASSDVQLELEGAIELEGTIVQVANVPSLTRAPYRQAVMEIRLAEVKSSSGDLPREIVLLGMGVEDRKPMAMTHWKVGSELKISVVSWGTVQERFGRLHRFSLEDPDFELLDAARFWIVE